MDTLNGSKLRGCVLFHFKHHTNHSSARFLVLATVLLKIYFFQVLRSCLLKNNYLCFNGAQSPLLSGQNYFLNANTEGSGNIVLLIISNYVPHIFAIHLRKS